MRRAMSYRYRLLLAASYLFGAVRGQPQEEINCVPEFGKCVMNRDCCNFNKGDDPSTLECVAGDWAVTTDSTCLSARSKILEQLTKAEKIHLLKEFYDNKVPPTSRKSTAEVVKLYEKFARSFAKLVVRLETKYELNMVDNIYNQNAEEL